MWCCCLDWSENPLETLLQQSSLFLNIVWVRKLFSSSRSSISRSLKWWIVFITMSSCLHLNNVLDCGHKPWQSWPWCGRHQAHREEPGSVSVSRTNQSPAPCLYCTHTLTAQRKKEMPKIVSVPPGLPAHTGMAVCPGPGPSPLPEAPCHTYVVHTHKIYQVFLTHFLPNNSSEEKVITCSEQNFWGFSFTKI